MISPAAFSMTLKKFTVWPDAIPEPAGAYNCAETKCSPAGVRNAPHVRFAGPTEFFPLDRKSLYAVSRMRSWNIFERARRPAELNGAFVNFGEKISPFTASYRM